MSIYFLTAALLVGQVPAVRRGVTPGVGFLHAGPVVTAVGEGTTGDPCEDEGKLGLRKGTRL